MIKDPRRPEYRPLNDKSRYDGDGTEPCDAPAPSRYSDSLITNLGLILERLSISEDALCAFNTRYLGNGPENAEQYPEKGTCEKVTAEPVVSRVNNILRLIDRKFESLEYNINRLCDIA